MGYTLFSLVTWGALVLLILPERKMDVLQTAVVLLLGMIWIVAKRPRLQKIKFPKCLLGLVAVILVLMGQCFYGRWMDSAKILPIARLLHLPVFFLVSATAVVLTVCAGGAALYITQRLYVILSDPTRKAEVGREIAACLIMGCVTAVLVQIMIGVDIVPLGPVKFLGNMLIPAIASLLLYCLLGKALRGAALGTGMAMLLSTVNVYVHQFRDRLLEPVDVFSAGTALNVAQNYSLWPIPAAVVAAWALWLAALLGLRWIMPKGKSMVSARAKWLLALCCVTAAVGVGCLAHGLQTYHWDKQGAQNNGFLLDFAAKIKEAFVLPPEGYSADAVEQLADRYAQHAGQPERTPHVIVIMDEAFSDLSVHGELPTEEEVMPFISSLQENTLRGYALASVYGGNTANSEFEFLTGNSMAWLSENAVPYQQYIRGDAYCMVSDLKRNYGYRCIAMHPYLSSGWNRPAVYEAFGFDEQYFLEDFPQEDLIRDYVSDREMFAAIISAFEENRNKPMFLFGVTMQNHGGYEDRSFETTVNLTGQGMDYPDVEQYLSLIRETDRAVEELIGYFSCVQEEVVILFFGDHQPMLDDAFFRALGNAEETPEERQKRYQVPFFLWANYDIGQQSGILTSLNYLSTYVYEAAGIPLPAYNRFLADMAQTIPAINSRGFYSNASGCYLTFEEASAEEQRWLAEYRMLQYNSLWDPESRSDRFFPLPPSE